MKILIASSSGLFDASFPETNKNNSGFGHMIRALADMLTIEDDEVDIITQSNITKGRQIGKAHLIKKTYLDLFIHFKPYYMIKLLEVIFRHDFNFGMKARLILYYMTGSYCEYVLKKNKYDIVHLNGTSISSIPLMLALTRTNTPFSLTLHGLISFDDAVKVDNLSKKLEREMLIEAKNNPNFRISVVSSGVKRRILNYLDVEHLENIQVICNPIIPVEK